VELLLTARAVVDHAKNNGATSLFVAAQNGQATCVKLLLAACAVVEKARNDGGTPLRIAAQNRNDKCVELLLQALSNAAPPELCS
jgi:ankyrin repeat protein